MQKNYLYYQSFWNNYGVVETLNTFAFHHNQSNFDQKKKKKLKAYVWSFTILSCSAFNFDFVTNVFISSSNQIY